jgi:hypothetical protein
MNVLDTPTKTTLMTAICVTAIATTPTISWQTGGASVICTSTLDASTPFTVSAGVATLNHSGSAVSAGNPLVSTANAGASAVVALAKFLTAATAIFQLSVGTSASDINLTSVTVAGGETITLTGLTITPA